MAKFEVLIPTLYYVKHVVEAPDNATENVIYSMARQTPAIEALRDSEITYSYPRITRL